MSRGKHLSLEEARNSGSLKQFAKEQPSEGDGAYKFVLRSIADGDADMMAQTRMLIDEVLPEVYAEGFEGSVRS